MKNKNKKITQLPSNLPTYNLWNQSCTLYKRNRFNTKEYFESHYLEIFSCSTHSKVVNWHWTSSLKAGQIFWYPYCYILTLQMLNAKCVIHVKNGKDAIFEAYAIRHIIYIGMSIWVSKDASGLQECRPMPLNDLWIGLTA